MQWFSYTETISSHRNYQPVGQQRKSEKKQKCFFIHNITRIIKVIITFTPYGRRPKEKRHELSQINHEFITNWSIHHNKIIYGKFVDNSREFVSKEKRKHELPWINHEFITNWSIHHNKIIYGQFVDNSREFVSKEKRKHELPCNYPRIYHESKYTS